MTPPATSRTEPDSSPQPLTIRELIAWNELEQATELYRDVFGYETEQGGLNPRLLSGLIRHGGSVVGALADNGTVVGFAFGWTAVDIHIDHRSIYHYSQAAVVRADVQGQGVGRQLKEVQSVIAARYGADRMRWTFDPLLSRNAHFNFDVLGATGCWFQRDAMGPGADRITVEWVFSDDVESDNPAQPSTSRTQLPNLELGETLRESINGAEHIFLAIPTSIPTDPGQAQALRAEIGSYLEAGYLAVSCRLRNPDVAIYTFRKA